MRPESRSRVFRLTSRAAALLIAALTAVVLVPAASQAADSSDFNPGFLISDEDFFNSKALTAAQTDSFIRGINAGCLAGRVCLENYKETIKAKASNSRCAAVSAASNQTAGQIIAKVAVACGISPKAILVILQKEQSLVTATAPSSTAFQASMGAGCPDTAPCDGKYAGFYENVYYGAYLLKGYTIPGSSNYSRYAAGTKASIAYSPKSYGSSPTCGFKSVTVLNQATHALYVYTPYTPNAAALKNLYGTGDSCSAYGNRNFWRLWTDWFGPTGSEGTIAIAQVYADLGGTGSYLGAVDGAPVRVEDAGGGIIQTYAGGQIVWNQKYGAHAMSGAFATKWAALGGAAKIGWPRDDITVVTNSNGTGKYQTYSNAQIVWVQSKGTFRVYGAYLKAVQKAGGYDGYVGWPLGDVSGNNQQFQGGWVFYNAADATSGVVENDIAASYVALGGPARWGSATARGASSTAAGGGIYQDFSGGRIVVSANHGARAIYGGYLTTWKANGGPDGVLGWPIANSFTDPASGYPAQKFDGGTIYNASKAKGYVGAAFAATVAKAGGVTGKYGFPSTGVRTTATGSGQDFKGWTLASTSSGVRSLHGSVRTAWLGYKGEKGVLGWPIGSATVVAGVTSQPFENGTIYVKGSKKTYVGTHFVAALQAAGGVTGRYGWPTSGVMTSTANGGGEVQKFGTIVLTWRATGGTKSVYGPLVTPWYAYKAYSGPLGWPTSGQLVDTKSGARYQDFQGGRLYVLGTKHGYVATGLVSEYSTAGGPSGTWGWPKAAPKTADGVVTQVFDKGTATFDGTTVTFTKK